MKTLRTLVSLAALLLAGARCAAPPAHPPAVDRRPPVSVADLDRYLGRRWYGLYLVGRKIGYAESEIARTELEGQEAVSVSLSLHAKVAMLGVPQELAVTERRVYVLGEGLAAFETSSEAAGSSLRISGRVSDGALRVTSAMAGRERVTETEAPDELFEDYIAEGRLVREGAREGDKIAFTQYQPTLGRSVTAVSRVKEIRTRPMGGVPTRVYVVETAIREMGIASTSILAEDGEVLETQIGGGFTMRLEEERTARDIDYRSDVLLSTVIRPAEPIERPGAVRRMKVRLTGVRDRELLIPSERQTYTVGRGGDAVLVVAVEEIDGLEAPAIPLPRERFPEELAPTIFIQSDSPEVIERARAVVGDERDARAASDALVRWVHANVQKQFSASLSNALDVLATMSGDCTEHSVLFVALARAVGLPAREVSGIVYTDEDESFYYHQWAEVFVGKWIAVDPTYGQVQADATHIMFARGDLFSQARLLNLIGALGIEIIEYEHGD
ncbi:MAG: transglutaminase domain-containing protein [bacterium]|nr:transglutaminase domain-containing protein [bacterium]